MKRVSEADVVALFDYLARTPAMVQPYDRPLFPMGLCECEHVYPVASDGEPCPICMADQDRPHDCALRVKKKARGRRE